MTRQLPTETPASAALRRELFSSWEPEAAVARRVPDFENLRRDGRLLAVWVRELGEYRYPTFQFYSEGQPIPELKPLLQLLRTAIGDQDERLHTGWSEVEWLYSGHTLLDARTPAECFAVDARAVLAAAVQEFSDEHDSNW